MKTFLLAHFGRLVRGLFRARNKLDALRVILDELVRVEGCHLRVRDGLALVVVKLASEQKNEKRARVSTTKPYAKKISSFSDLAPTILTSWRLGFFFLEGVSFLAELSFLATRLPDNQDMVSQLTNRGPFSRRCAYLFQID